MIQKTMKVYYGKSGAPAYVADVKANIYRRRNGEYGSSCNGLMDTGHRIIHANGRFTVYSAQEWREDDVIARDATRREAERAIERDWAKT